MQVLNGAWDPFGTEVRSQRSEVSGRRGEILADSLSRWERVGERDLAKKQPTDPASLPARSQYLLGSFVP